ncbi:hypothetical protein HII17_09935 [Thalassotalea sp. M1531]|uniref:Uncharacterized protein n=1 Tax=Thalassotalea algicola TaxID=2716224 RepID=A0A7Y0LEV2_9GAMM|nr:hypothetical protein [Thalassotalea algicola]NMP31885.1 hypothetical protein [Thalassotalea algicola]
MSTFDEQLKWRIETADSAMVLSEAPDFANDIWRRHQVKQLTKVVSVTVCSALIAISGWMYNMSQSPVAMPAYIVQSHQYEQQLANYAQVQLSDTHSAIIANWHHELSVIDQTLERGKGNLYNVELWQRRTNLLKMMVDFYTKPIDLYEI